MKFIVVVFSLLQLLKNEQARGLAKSIRITIFRRHGLKRFTCL